MQTVFKAFPAICKPLSVKVLSGMPYGMIHAYDSISAMWATVVLLVGITQVSSAKRSAITTNNLFPLFIYGSGPDMSMAINFNGLWGEGSGGEEG